MHMLVMQKNRSSNQIFPKIIESHTTVNKFLTRELQISVVSSKIPFALIYRRVNGF